MPLIIPPEINSFSMAQAFQFYRDELRFLVYPVYPRWADKAKDPGKQPAIKEWWNYDPQDCDIAKWFKNGRPYNIGMAPRDGIRLVDLDSKPDQGKSVREYLADRPQISAPAHVSRGGDHLVYYCPDIPRWKKPSQTSLKFPVYPN
jgi:hypothetical protein